MHCWLPKSKYTPNTIVQWLLRNVNNLNNLRQSKHERNLLGTYIADIAKLLYLQGYVVNKYSRYSPYLRFNRPTKSISEVLSGCLWNRQRNHTKHWSKTPFWAFHGHYAQLLYLVLGLQILRWRRKLNSRRG